MKKSLLLILASLFAVFSLTACADEDKNDTAGEVNGGTPVVNPASEYVGTYDVTFFATKPSMGGQFDMVAMGTMTTDCAKAGELGILTPVDKESPDVKSECKINGELNKDIANIIDQQAVITYDENTGLTIETKLQIWKEIMSLSPNDIYQYTKYTAVPVTSITAEGVNVVSANAVKGVSGRHLTAKSTNPLSTFKVTKMSDGNLYVELDLIDKETLVGKVNAPTYVILKKKSDTPVTINPDSLFTSQTGIACSEEQAQQNMCPDDFYAKFKPTPDEAAQ
ncbi:hypothetical protein [Mucispirillum schaedleri]|uniref:hypothetical protein n=1 Tax=Mucispirillum schaedleri TaxID=248039 RepID=UPI001F59B7BD|nr:hypothetical protein [Mucispirillum schaedleri]